MVKRRNNIVSVKRNTPKKVTLPNGRTFFAKYKRVTRQYLPSGRTIGRTYRGQPAKGRRRPAAGVVRPTAHAKPAAAVGGRRQGGKGLTDVLKSVAKNPFAQEIAKKLATKGVNAIPSLYKKATNKIKNKHLKKLPESEIAADILNEGTKRIYGRII